MFEQCRQYLKGLLLEFYADTLFAQFASQEVGLKYSETNWPRGIHEWLPPGSKDSTLALLVVGDMR
jgi:hypothetical protein